MTIFPLPQGSILLIVLIATLTVLSVVLWSRARRAEGAYDKASDTIQQLQAEVAVSSQAEQRYRSLVDLATDGIIIADFDQGLFVEKANPRIEEIYSLRREELLGHYGPQDMSPEYQPNGRRSDEMARGYIKGALEGEVQNFEWMHKNAQGEEVPCQIILSRFPHPTRRLARASVIDLRERKREAAAREELENQLAQAQRMEIIGRMTGGVAHDFNNLLTVIRGNIELIQLTHKFDNEVNDGLNEVIAAAEKGAMLTRSMLNYARRAHLRPEPAQLGAIVRRMESLITRTLGANIEIETIIKAEKWKINADLAGVESALLNLVLNACDAMPEGGKLIIEVSSQETDASIALHDADGNAVTSAIVLTVKDTGCGIDESVLDRVFDPFFTTKDTSSNSGLGLSMVQGFMTQSGGDLKISSTPSQGTRVQLFFPAYSSNDVNSRDTTEDISEPNAQKIRILVAEDQEEVRTTICKMLDKMGHEVISADNGDKAMEMFCQDQAFDLLLTDINMPGGVQGFELARRLRGLRSDLSVIFMSGYAPDDQSADQTLSKGHLRLAKPVSFYQLKRAIATTIDA
ncbi:MAG: ATP-binding protein [Pseudomonadota bacterium]